MTRSETHERFVSRFHAGEPPAPATGAVERIERELGTVLPEAYAAFIETHGPISTRSLLPLIVREEAELWALWEIYPPAEVVDASRAYWSAGMSDQLIGFAKDAMGNLFCFRRIAPDAPRPADAEVWLFDHDFCEETKVSGGFDEWLQSYLALPSPDSEDGAGS